jgi:Multicopper oxidase
MGFINRTSWAPQEIPLLALPRRQWDEHQLVPWIPLPTHVSSDGGEKWVDVIINNLDDGSHPFHLHGHSFYVVASHRSLHGWGSYDPYSSAANAIVPQFNTVDPLCKDTVMVPRRGFAVLRLRLGEEDSGIWMLHCHVLVHQGSGMAMAIQVGGDEGHKAVDEGAKGLCRL